jgi:5-methylcytosine-specific restriction enzyme A
MKGQVFTIAKLHYVNGVVYHVAETGKTTLSALVALSAETTPSGRVKHPKHRISMLTRFAEGLGLVTVTKDGIVKPTELGKRFYEHRANQKWVLSNQQKGIVRNHVLTYSPPTPTVHSLRSLTKLIQEGHRGSTLAHKYAEAIGKTDAWQSEVTYEEFTKFGISYLIELGIINEQLQVIHPITSGKTVPRPAETYLFTWNPSGWPWTDLSQCVYEVNVEGLCNRTWSCGSTRRIRMGDRAFLMRLGIPPKGIMGSGVVVGEPFPAPHWDPQRAEKGEVAYRADLQFEVLDESPILSQQSLEESELNEHNWYPQASGTTIPPETAKRLEEIWTQLTGRRLNPVKVTETPELLIEGMKRSRSTVAYERNSNAREACLQHHGRSCTVCGMNFQDSYGEIGQGFIHVHHIVPISQIGESYQVNPEKDLAPVCPNCHAMLHRRMPPYSIQELRNILDEKPGSHSLCVDGD